MLFIARIQYYSEFKNNLWNVMDWDVMKLISFSNFLTKWSGCFYLYMQRIQVLIQYFLTEEYVFNLWKIYYLNMLTKVI